MIVHFVHYGKPGLLYAVEKGCCVFMFIPPISVITATIPSCRVGARLPIQTVSEVILSPSSRSENVWVANQPSGMVSLAPARGSVASTRPDKGKNHLHVDEKAILVLAVTVLIRSLLSLTGTSFRPGLGKTRSLFLFTKSFIRHWSTSPVERLALNRSGR